MTTRTLRMLLWSLGGLQLVAAAAVAACCFAWPLDQGVVAPQAPAVSRPALSAARTPDLAEFAPLWRKRLRPISAEDAAKAAAAQAAPQPPVKPPAAFPIKLVGTFYEPGRSLAVFQLGTKSELRSVGEMVGGPTGAEVLKIEVDHVEIRYQGATVTLELKPKEI